MPREIINVQVSCLLSVRARASITLSAALASSSLAHLDVIC